MKMFGGSESLIQEDWEKGLWGNNRAAIQFLESTGLLNRPQKILEIGSGKGYMLRYLVDKGHDAQGNQSRYASHAATQKRFL